MLVAADVNVVDLERAVIAGRNTVNSSFLPLNLCIRELRLNIGRFSLGKHEPFSLNFGTMTFKAITCKIRKSKLNKQCGTRRF